MNAPTDQVVGWPAHVHCVQPGFGPVATLAMAWGRLRRALLRWLRPHAVASRLAELAGQCPGCAHDVLDARDLLWVRNVCGLRLPASREIDPFCDRFGFVRLARAELVMAAMATVVLSTVCAIWQPWLLPIAMLPLLFTAWFFRDPERTPPTTSGVVVAAADGVLDDVRREPDCPFFPGPALRLGVFLSLFDVHVNRAPVAGRARRFDYRPGVRHATYRIGATDGNEQLITWFEADAGGVPVVVRQIAGPAARRVCCVLRAGERVAAGQRFGLIKFGSRTEVWLPDVADLELVAQPGQRVRSGETILARLPVPAPHPVNDVAAATSCAPR